MTRHDTATRVPPAGSDAARYPVQADALPPDGPEAGNYAVRFARTPAQLDEVLRVRYRIFNLELGEGLEESHHTGRDEDELDWRFHHLLIVDRRRDEVVGTYRMQTPEMAERFGGYYTATLFQLEGLPASILQDSVEIGRACVAREHRNGRVLHLLWRGLAAYLRHNGKHGLFGCCSLTSQDPALGLATAQELERLGQVHGGFSVAPRPEAACLVPAGAALPAAQIPALFQAYLNLGAKACSSPAIDRRFQTIDFLVLLRTGDLDPRVYRSFFE